LGYRLVILDSKIHKTLKKKSDYGRISASGTGPYKITMVHRNKGVIAERYEGFKGDPKYWRAPIKRIVGIHLPDDQTKIAELLTGGVDVVEGISPENAKAIEKASHLKVTPMHSNLMVFFAMDSAAISGNKALADPRVRRAVWMSIDRDSLLKHVVPGGDRALKMKALCFKSARSCKWTKDAPPYDPVKAKQLLAEAGYPNGFEFTLHAIQRIKDIGEAMAGSMRKIGIRMKVQPTNIGVYRRKQGKGELNSWLIAYPAGSFPDAGNHLAVFFLGSRTRYMGKDPIILKAIRQGNSEFDPKKRADIYAKAYDRANEMIYNMGVTSLPYVFGHHTDVRVARGQISAGNIHVNDFFWK
jgi:peptide/nickel transport system substrate-binding protein